MPCSATCKDNQGSLRPCEVAALHVMTEDGAMIPPTTPRPADAEARPGAWLWRHAEACLFWVLVAAHLVPIWTFTYLPTQDGPVHVSTAITLKNYGAPDTRYREFFEVRLQLL